MLIYMFKWNAFVFSFTFTTITFHPKYGLVVLKKYRILLYGLNNCKPGTCNGLHQWQR